MAFVDTLRGKSERGRDGQALAGRSKCKRRRWVGVAKTTATRFRFCGRVCVEGEGRVGLPDMRSEFGGDQ